MKAEISVIVDRTLLRDVARLSGELSRIGGALP